MNVRILIYRTWPIDRELFLPIKHISFRQIKQTFLQSLIQASKCKEIIRNCKWQLKEIKHLMGVKGRCQHHMSAFLERDFVITFSSLHRKLIYEQQTLSVDLDFLSSFQLFWPRAYRQQELNYKRSKAQQNSHSADCKRKRFANLKRLTFNKIACKNWIQVLEYTSNRRRP